MKLTLSQMAWTPSDDEAVAAVLRELSVRSIECLPERVSANLEVIKKPEVVAYREAWERRGVSISSLADLLGGREDLAALSSSGSSGQPSVHQGDSVRPYAEYLKRMISVGGALGAKALTLGSPERRGRGHLSIVESNERIIPIFRELGDHAARCGTILCIEASPVQSGGNYVQRSGEAIELVGLVSSSGFGFHLDIGAMLAEGVGLSQFIASKGSRIRHVHVSAPLLAPIETLPEFALREAFEALQGAGYQGYVSVAMKPVAMEAAATPGDAIRRSIDFIRKFYRFL